MKPLELTDNVITPKYCYYISFTGTKYDNQSASWGVCNAFTHYESSEPLDNMDAIVDAKDAIEGKVDGVKNVIIGNIIKLDRRFR